MSQLGGRVDAFLDEFFHLYPVSATAIGMHAVDGEWPDLTEAGRAARIVFADRWELELRGLADGDLTPDERIDRDLLRSEVAALRFDETELREDAWDALGYVYLLGGGIFPLLARDFAPLATRLGSVASRLEGVRAVLVGARHELGSIPSRPPSRLHTEMARKQLPGIVALAEDAVAQAVARARKGEGPTLVECKTYRYRGHSRSDPKKYRTKEEEKHWHDRDPITLFSAYLVSTAGWKKEEVDEVQAEVNREIAEAEDFAVNKSPYPKPEEVYEDVYAGWKEGKYGLTRIV